MKLKWNLFDFFLITFGGILAVISGHLIFNQYWFSGIISFLSFVIISFILSERKQNVNIYGTSAIPPPASNYPPGTVYIKHEK